jgi:hypothetical protein
VGSRAAEDLAAQWAARVRANRDQVERHRQVPETSDFYAPIHGEELAELPALDELVALLRARGGRTSIERIQRPPRVLDSEAPLLDLLRHQLWIAAGSEADERLVEAVRRSVTRTSQGITLEADGGWIGIVDWVPLSREAA